MVVEAIATTRFCEHLAQRKPIFVVLSVNIGLISRFSTDPGYKYSQRNITVTSDCRRHCGKSDISVFAPQARDNLAIRGFVRVRNLFVPFFEDVRLNTAKYFINVKRNVAL